MRVYLSAFLMLLGFAAAAQTDISGMITCFRQGEKDNGAAVALIKAAIAAFETGNVFQEKFLADKSSEITLRNGDKHILHPAELEEAANASGFELVACKDSSVLRYVHKCYAVMAKEIQSSAAGMSFTEALSRLEQDIDVSTMYTLLGLEKNIKHFRNRTYIENLCATVVWRGKEAVFHCHGLIDKNGKERSMNISFYGRFQIVDEWDADQ